MPETPQFKRAEIWTGFEADGGAPKTLSPGAVLVDVSTMTRREEINGDHWLRFDLPRSSLSWGSSGLFERDVIRLLTEEDGSEIVEEYRVVEFKEARGANRKVAGSVECEGPVFDLRGDTIVARTESNGLTQPDFTILGFTATELINSYILPAAPSYWSLGTVDTTEEIESFSFDFDTPLSALRRLAEITGTEIEILRPSGSSYTFGLRTAIGSSAVKPLVHVGINVRTISKRTDTRKQVNQLWGKGGGIVGNRLTLGENAWVVASISGDLGGGDRDVVLSGGPIWKDDVLETAYLGELDRTGLQAVLDTTASTDTVRVNGAPSYSVGERVRFYRNAAADDLAYLEDPTSQTLYGIVPGSFSAEDLIRSDNFILTPRMDGTYTAGVPANWTAVGSPTVSENTNADFTQIGGKSCRVQATAADEGLISDAVTLTPTALKPYFSSLASIWVVSGAIRIELIHSVDGTLPPAETKAWTQKAGTWVDMSINGLPLGSGTVQLQIVSDGGAAEFYVDGALLNNEADSGVFVSESAANALWLRTANQLNDIALPSIEYDLEPIDVSGIDSATYPYSKYTLGGDARVMDPDLANDINLRVVALETDVLRGIHSRLELSSRPTKLTDEGAVKALRQRRNAQADLSARFFYADLVDKANGTTNLKFAVDPDRARSVRYAVSETSQPTRATALTGTIVNATTSDAAVSGVSAFATAVYVTVVAFSGASGTGQAGESRQLLIERESNWLKVLTETPVSVASINGVATWQRDVDLEFGPKVASFRAVISSFVVPNALDDQPPPSSTVGPFTYDVNVTGNTTITHRVQDGAGDPFDISLAYDEGTLLAGFQGNMTITFTPYDAVGGGGGAGTAGPSVVLQTKNIPDYDDVGVRGQHLQDVRFDNNDPGTGTNDLDMDNVANGFAFDYTVGGTAVELSQVAVYLKKTGSPTGDAVVRVYADSAGLPGSQVGADSGTFDVSTLATSYGAFGSANMQVFDFATPITLSASTLYHIAVEYPSGDATNYVSINSDSSGASDELNGSWAAGPANLIKYRIYEELTVESISRSASPGKNTSMRYEGGILLFDADDSVSGALGGLTDVTITAAATGEYLRYNGSAWVDAVIQLADLPAIAVEDLSDTTITAAGAGDFLRHNGSAWVDDVIQTSDLPAISIDDLSDVTLVAAANLDVLAHNGSNWADVALTAAHIQSGAFADARISESSVTQHQAAMDLLTIEGLVDPNADRMLFWDDSVGSFAFLDAGIGLAFDGATGLDVDFADGLRNQGGQLQVDISGFSDFAATLLATDEILLWDKSAAAGVDHFRLEIGQLDLSLMDNSTSLFTAGAYNIAGDGLTDSGATILVDYQSTSNVVSDAFDGTGITVVSGDRMLVYDVSEATATRVKFINVSQIPHDSLTGFLADEHVAHSGVTLTAGVGITGGGDISANRTFDLDISSLTTDAGPLVALDRFAVHVDGTGTRNMAPANVPLALFSQTGFSWTHTHNASDIDAGTLLPIRGGTGVSSPGVETVLIGQGASAMTTIAATIGTGFLRSNGTIWAHATIVASDLPSHNHAAGDINSGILSVTRGGTGVADPTSGYLLVGAGASAMTLLNPAGDGGYVRSNAGAWVRSSGVPYTDLDSFGAEGQLIVSNVGLTATFLDSGAAGGYVRSNGTTWVRSTIQAADIPVHSHAGSDIDSGVVGTAYGGTGVSSPTADGVLVTNGASAMTVVDSGASGGYLRSNGTSWFRSAIIEGDLPDRQVADISDLDNDFATATVVANVDIDAFGKSLLDLSEPAADRIVFFDLSKGGGLGQYEFLTVSTGLSITGTTLTATAATYTGGDGINISGGDVISIDGASGGAGLFRTAWGNAITPVATDGIILGDGGLTGQAEIVQLQNIDVGLFGDDGTYYDIATGLVAGDIPNLDTAKITTGTFLDARISSSSVTQHQAAMDLLTIEGLVDPNADRILFWDDVGTAGFAFLTLGTNLSITGTTLNAASSGLDTAGTGLIESPAGTVAVKYAATSNLIDGAAAGTIDAADDILFWDAGDSIVKKDSVQDLVSSAAVTEAQITDGSILARLAAAETVSGQWTFSARVDFDADIRLEDTAPSIEFFENDVAADEGGWRLVASATDFFFQTRTDAFGAGQTVMLFQRGTGTAIGSIHAYADFRPSVDSTTDLGTTGVRWLNAYIDTLTLTNALSQAYGGTGIAGGIAADQFLIGDGTGNPYVASGANLVWSGTQLTINNATIAHTGTGGFTGDGSGLTNIVADGSSVAAATPDGDFYPILADGATGDVSHFTDTPNLRYNLVSGVGTLEAERYQAGTDGTMLITQDTGRFNQAGLRVTPLAANVVAAFSMAPSGTEDRGIFRMYNDSDTTNTDALELEVDGAIARIRSGQSFGTPGVEITELRIEQVGTSPITFHTNGAEHFRLAYNVITFDVPMRGGAGSVSSPTFSFTGASNNTGIYEPAADQVGISINGTNRFTLSNTLLDVVVPITAAGSVNPATDSLYNIGTGALRWATGYFDTIDATTYTGLDASDISAGTFTGAFTFTSRLDLTIGSTIMQRMQNSAATVDVRQWDFRIDAGGTFEVRSTTDAGTTVVTALQLEHATGDLTLKGWVRSEDGSSAAPTYSFANDTDTGMRLVSAGILRLSAGSDGQYLDISSASGNVSSNANFVISTSSSEHMRFGDSITSTALEPYLAFYTYDGATNARSGYIQATADDLSDGDLRIVSEAHGGSRIRLMTGGANTRFLATDTYVHSTVVHRFVDGSRTAPGLTFNADTNIGLYRIASNDIGYVQDEARFQTVGGTTNLDITLYQAATERARIRWDNTEQALVFAMGTGIADRLTLDPSSATAGIVSVDNSQFGVACQGSDLTGATWTIDWDLGNQVTGLNQSSTTVPTTINVDDAGMVAGHSYILLVKAGTGGVNGSAVTWNTVANWVNNVKPTFNQTVGDYTVVQFMKERSGDVIGSWFEAG